MLNTLYDLDNHITPASWLHPMPTSWSKLDLHGAGFGNFSHHTNWADRHFLVRPTIGLKRLHDLQHVSLCKCLRDLGIVSDKQTIHYYKYILYFLTKKHILYFLIFQHVLVKRVRMILCTIYNFCQKHKKWTQQTHL